MEQEIYTLNKKYIYIKQKIIQTPGHLHKLSECVLWEEKRKKNFPCSLKILKIIKLTRKILMAYPSKLTVGVWDVEVSQNMEILQGPSHNPFC